MTRITNWTQKASFQRYIYAIVKQVNLTFWPLLMGVVTTAAWYFGIWKNQIRFEDADTERLMLTTAPLLGLALLFVGGFAYQKVDDRKQKVVLAVMKQDRETFLMYRDERTSNVVLVFLATTGILLVLQMMLNFWDTAEAGGFAVAVTTFVPAKFWTIVSNLDNPVKSSRWLAERVPPEWMAADVDKTFKLGGSLEPVKAA